MDGSQLIVEFRFHLLKVQPCAIYNQLNDTKILLRETMLYHSMLIENEI